MKQPNILFVFSDQQHWQAAGFEDPFFRTPNLDRFAGESTVFRRSFCTTPQCSPSRSSMLTGLYPHKTRVEGNVGMCGGPPLRMPTIAPELAHAGYRTGYFGKWHLGDEPVATAGWGERYPAGDSDTGNDEDTCRRGVEFLQARGADAGGRGQGGQAGRSGQSRQKPFALFLSFNDPHDVYHYDPDDLPDDDAPLPESWRAERLDAKAAVQKQFMTDDQGRVIHGLDESRWRRYRLLYRERTGEYDARLGRVLDALESAGLADDTVVIATSDHGDMDTHHRLIFKGPFMYEHMVRVPLAIRVPERLGGAGSADRDELVVNVDLAPTLRELAGLEARPSDGQSLAGLLTGGDWAGRDFVIGEYYGKQRWENPIRMIRTDRWKYNLYAAGDEELYDLRDDPHELTNRADDEQCADFRRDFRARLERWMADNDDPFPTYRPTDRAGNPIGGA